jgi:hypothetical protein
MKTLIAVIALATVALTADLGLASNCPVAIKQGREAAAKMKADDPKVKQALAKLDDAQKLHDSGKHSDSLKAADEALGLLGVKK